MAMCFAVQWHVSISMGLNLDFVLFMQVGECIRTCNVEWKGFPTNWLQGTADAR